MILTLILTFVINLQIFSIHFPFFTTLISQVQQMKGEILITLQKINKMHTSHNFLFLLLRRLLSPHVLFEINGPNKKKKERHGAIQIRIVVSVGQV